MKTTLILFLTLLQVSFASAEYTERENHEAAKALSKNFQSIIIDGEPTSIEYAYIYGTSERGLPCQVAINVGQLNALVGIYEYEKNRETRRAVFRLMTPSRSKSVLQKFGSFVETSDFVNIYFFHRNSSLYNRSKHEAQISIFPEAGIDILKIQVQPMKNGKVIRGKTITCSAPWRFEI